MAKLVLTRNSPSCTPPGARCSPLRLDRLLHHEIEALKASLSSQRRERCDVKPRLSLRRYVGHEHPIRRQPCFPARRLALRAFFMPLITSTAGVGEEGPVLPRSEESWQRCGNPRRNCLQDLEAGVQCRLAKQCLWHPDLILFMLLARHGQWRGHCDR